MNLGIGSYLMRLIYFKTFKQVASDEHPGEQGLHQQLQVRKLFFVVLFLYAFHTEKNKSNMNAEVHNQFKNRAPLFLSVDIPSSRHEVDGMQKILQ